MTEEAPLDRATMERQLEALVEQRLSLDGLRRWFTPLLVGTRSTVEQDEPLLFSIAFLFEDESLSETAHTRNAGRLLRAFRVLERDAVLMKLIAMITDQDRLCDVIGKFREGTITRTGYLSAISNTRYTREIKERLLQFGSAELALLCETLESCQYSKTAAMMELV